MTRDFWDKLDSLVAASAIKIERPRGTAHPRYPSSSYPLDYGFLEGTRSSDGGEIDVWIGSLQEKRATAVILCVDLEKRDAEVKVLLGCTPQEAQAILAWHNSGGQAAMLIDRLYEE